MRDHRHGRREVHLQLAADQVVHHRAAALVGDVLHLQARQHTQHLAGEVLHAAARGRPVVERAGLGLRVRDEFLQRIGRNRRIDHHHQPAAADASHAGEILYGIVGRRQQVRRDHVVYRHHHDRVAVGRSLRDRIGADDGRGAGTVLHQDLLSPDIRELLRHHPRERVRAAACGIRDDEAHRLARVGGGLRERRRAPEGRAGKPREFWTMPWGCSLTPTYTMAAVIKPGVSQCGEYRASIIGRIGQLIGPLHAHGSRATESALRRVGSRRIWLVMGCWSSIRGVRNRRYGASLSVS